MASIHTQSNGDHHLHEMHYPSNGCHEFPPHVQHQHAHAMQPHGNGRGEALPHVQHHHYQTTGLLEALPHVRHPPAMELHGNRLSGAHVPHVVALHGSHACILAIARAVPPHKLIQRDFADFYFNITNCQHKTQLKHKMTRICERSGVETRYSIMTEEFLKEHPELYTPGRPSLEERHQFLAEEVPRLAAEAGRAALQEWGRPAHDITHLVVVTLSGVAMPGADVRLVQMLGLRPCVRRVMLYMLGCYAGVTALRVAKDLAENNPGSRVLICCSELSATTFRAPHEASPYNLVASALFGDGAVGVVVGAHPNLFGDGAVRIVGAALNSTSIHSAHENGTSNGINNAHGTSPYIGNSNVASTNLKAFTSHSNHVIYNSSNHHLNPSHTNGTNNGLSTSNNYNKESHTSIFANGESKAQTTCMTSDSISNTSSHPCDSPFMSALRSPDSNILIMEHPIYEIHTAIETIIPNTENIIEGNMRVEGLEFYLDRALPSIVSDHVAQFCEVLVKDIPRKSSLKDVFWAVHPGGPAILDAVEEAAKLDGDHLQASRNILSQYGNISASTVLFVLDEIRKSSTSPEWGIALAFGPGITFEGVLLRRVAIH